MRIKTVIRSIRDLWIIFGVTFLFLLLCEGGLRILFYFRGPEISLDYRRVADVYENVDWVDPYFEEFTESLVAEWSPYVYWRRKPFAGNYINVDSQGLRKTWNPTDIEDTQSSAEATMDIFVFGGSTIWGTGARDDYTIPSLLSKKLADSGVRATVTNFGQSGYINTQEVLTLIRELQNGNIPDLVIFYNGANDIYSTYQNQIAGIPQNEINRIEEFGSSLRFNASMATRNLLKSLALSRFAKGIAYRLGVRRGPASNHSESLLEPDKPAPSISELAEDILDIYEKNIEIVQSLSDRYSFKALFYWQPTIFGKDSLTGYETEERSRFGYMETLTITTVQLLHQRNLSQRDDFQFRDLSTLFKKHEEPIFIDWWHIVETGNQQVADQFVNDTISILSN